MSDVTNCSTCGATCRIVGRDREGSPKLQAFQNTDAQNKIEQLKKSLHQIQETLRTERATAKAKTSDIEQLNNALHYFQELFRTERAAANAKISNLEAELSNLRALIGVPVSREKLSP